MKHKRYLASMAKLAIAAVVGFMVTEAISAEATIDGVTWKYSVSSYDHGATIVSSSSWNTPAVPTSTSGAITVPSELGGYPVVAIGDGAFRGCSRITSLQFPEGIVRIEGTPFHGCTALKSFNIPASVESVGSLGLDDTALLKDAKDGLVIVDGWVLRYNGVCPKDVVIPSGVVGLADNAFYWQELVESVEIPEGVSAISAYAFACCSALTTVKLPSSLLSIEDGAFSECYALTSIEIPSSVKSIGQEAFQYCFSLTEVTIPAGVESIGAMVFAACEHLKSLTLEAGLTTIPDGAFSSCQALTSVTIPEGVTAIGHGAFMSCMSLKSVFLPASLSDLGESVFEYCNDDLEITIDENNEYYCAENGLLLSKDKSRLIEYYSSSAIHDGVLEIPDGVKAIGTRTFSFCSGFTKLVLPPSVEEIGEAAFENCGDMKTISFSTGLKTIGYAAFSGCSGLTEVTFPEGLEKIGGFAFGGSGGLASVSFPKSLKILGSWAFDSTKFLMDSPNGFVIADDVLIKYKGPCTAEVVIPEGVRVIAADAFRELTSLTSITIPASVKSMGEPEMSAFNGCSGLKKVCISDLAAWCGVDFNESPSPLWYAHHLYLNGVEIVDLVIPESVESISASAFEYCASLKSVTIPASVKDIGVSSFASCNGIETVVFKGQPPVGLKSSSILASGRRYYYPPEEFPRQWKQYVGVYGLEAFAGYFPADLPVSVEVLSSEIRASDPTVMDVVYKVTSGCPKVRVRALAFKDGERSFAKVIRPETFIEGTEANIGDEIEANVEHKLSWRVSADYGNELAKIKFEVLANVGDLLTLTWVTIPKSEYYGTLRVSRNEVGEAQVFDALLWLYAAKDPSLMLTGGVLTDGSVALVNGTEFFRAKASGQLGEDLEFDYRESAVRTVFNRMGYGTVGADGGTTSEDGAMSVLGYVNEETRFGLSPKGFRQYAYKVVED